MRSRVVGSALVVAISLVPTLIGGPVFSAFMLVLGCLAYREFLSLAATAGAGQNAASNTAGYLGIAALALAGLVASSPMLLFTATVFSVIAPLVLSLPTVPTTTSLPSWPLVSAGALYLGLPTYAAVTLRQLPGAVDALWLTDWAQSISLGWAPSPKGLAWALVAILTIWVGDSTAYLVGRAFGRIRLAPTISPGKTIEGAIGGLLGSMVVGGAAFTIFGLGPWWLGLLIGAVLGAAGQLGDLSESLLKRQAGVKDSGSLIPGHGGLLDRIDALLFAIPIALILATGLERLGFP